MGNAAEAGLREDELRFLALVAPMGLDWISTRADFLRRHGQTSYHGWKDIIRLPASTALSASPLEFAIYLEADAMDLPPECLWADFLPHADARDNQREMEQQLRAKLGPPIAEDTSNCLVRVWNFGVFKVSLHCFPPDLQPRELTRPGMNPLLDRNPFLRAAARVTLASDYAFALPDPTLAHLSELIARMDQPGPRAACRLPVRAREGKIRSSMPRRETRRNPAALAGQISPDLLVAWRDESTNRIGLSAQRDSLCFTSAPSVQLVLTELEPARGAGGWSLDLETTEPAGGKRLVSLLDGGLEDPIEPTARQLAKLWRVALRRESAHDD